MSRKTTCQVIFCSVFFQIWTYFYKNWYPILSGTLNKTMQKVPTLRTMCLHCRGKFEVTDWAVNAVLTWTHRIATKSQTRPAVIVSKFVKRVVSITSCLHYMLDCMAPAYTCLRSRWRQTFRAYDLKWSTYYTLTIFDTIIESHFVPLQWFMKMYM